MYTRSIQEELLSLANDYPIISLMGPRQSGKTTLVRDVFTDKPYANLEEPDQRTLAKNDPKGFLSQFKNGAILDEVQRAPELLSYLQVIVDQKPEPGQFILTGSHQLELHGAISQSLAGRVALLTLYPLTINELQIAGIDLTLDELIYRGFFPRVYANQLNPTKVYRNYVATYLEKDVRQLSNIKDLSLFQNFMKLCAGRIGKVIDYVSLGNDLGVSNNTIKQWLSILEASYVIYRLKPYFENFGKRIIKSPKLYFTDVGLATYLLDIEQPQQVTRDPLRGFLVENLVIMELCKYRHNRGLDPNLYYFRDNHRNEVDVIIKQANQLSAIEIKSAQTYKQEFLKGLKYYRDLVGDRFKQGYLVYAGDLTQETEGFQLLNYKQSTCVF